MNFLDKIIAAKDGDRFGWIIPLVVFGFWIFNAIAKGKEQKDYDDKLDDKLDNINTRNAPRKYKDIKQEPETIYIAPPKEILRKKLRAKQIREAQVCASVHDEQKKAVKPKPKPQPRKVRRPAPRPVAKYNRSQEEPKREELEILPEVPESMIENIREPQTIRDAIVFSEIIGQPRSLNQWQY